MNKRQFNQAIDALLFDEGFAFVPNTDIVKGKPRDNHEWTAQVEDADPNGWRGLKLSIRGEVYGYGDTARFNGHLRLEMDTEPGDGARKEFPVARFGSGLHNVRLVGDYDFEQRKWELRLLEG